MKKIIKNILILTALVILSYIFRAELSLAVKQIQNKYFPCQVPIAYSIGAFDERFGLSDEEFKNAISSAEAIWEDKVGRELFRYKEDGFLKVNLIYDTRQEATEKLEEIDKELDTDKSTYNALKAKYDSLKLSYNNERVALEDRIEAFEIRKSAYEEQVNYWNSQGGATREKYDELEKEKTWINNEASALNILQIELNKSVQAINETARSLNALAGDLNLNVEKFNEIGGMHGEEFEEGTYERDQYGERINIYQFENKGKLIRVLAHELGHALGLDHVEEKEAIMYRLNNGINQELAQSDLDAVKAKCEL